MAVPEVHNPAYIGALECTKVSLLDKHQWLLFSGAPHQQLLSANVRFDLSKIKKNGLGIAIQNDVNGPNKSTGGNLAFAHHIMVVKSKGHWISMALQASGYYSRLIADDFIANTMEDPLIQNGNRSDIAFNASAGFMYYTKTFNGGLSLYQLVPNESFVDSDYKSRPLIILHADNAFPLNSDLAWCAGTKLLYEHNQHSSVDLNIGAEALEKYWLALSLRSYVGAYENIANSALIYAGINLEKLSLKYSLDIGLSQMQLRNIGSHEICIALRFCKKDCGCKD